MKKQITYTPISSNNNPNLLGDVIKLGIDVHRHKYVVVQKVDGSLPERPRSFTPGQFLVWVDKLREPCQCLYSCYEAGCVWLRASPQTGGTGGNQLRDLSDQLG